MRNMHVSVSDQMFGSALASLKQATTADKMGDVQTAMRNYRECLGRAKGALEGLPESKSPSCKQMIDQVTRRLQELETMAPVFQPAPAPQQYAPQAFAAPMRSMPMRATSNGAIQRPVQQQQRQESDQMQQMQSAIVNERPNTKFDDVAGLDAAKQLLKEAVIMPLKLPEMYVGPTRPWAGILLYGPPGTGKSFLAKAVAGEATNTHFLTVSNADLTSKWVGESEKLVKALFETARRVRPAVVFIDEIDSLVSQRGDNDTESGKRIKTEFLTQMDGVNSHNEGVLIIAATNLPWELDQAMLRRFERRIYIPLPDKKARFVLIKNQLRSAYHNLTEAQMAQIAGATEGYSGADLATLIRDALMRPIREFEQATEFCQCHGVDLKGVERDGLWAAATGMTLFKTTRKCRWEDLPKDDLARPIARFDHFKASLERMKPSVDRTYLKRYQQWTREMGESGV